MIQGLQIAKCRYSLWTCGPHVGIACRRGAPGCMYLESQEWLLVQIIGIGAVLWCGGLGISLPQAQWCLSESG